MEASIVSVPKPDRLQENYGPIPLMNTDAKFLTRVLTNQIHPCPVMCCMRTFWSMADPQWPHEVTPELENSHP